MRIAELLGHQDYFESRRGINNGHFNVPRIQVELNEAAVETEPLKALEELIDVIIITGGGIVKAAHGAGIDFDEVENMIMLKIQLNSIKYPTWVFDEMEPIKAQEYCRYVWNLDQPDLGTPNDYY